MWCKNCQQDVPAIASPEETTPRCAKCRCLLSSPTNETAEHTPPASVRGAINTEWLDRPTLDDWELDEDLDEAQRLVDSLGVGSSPDATLRFDRSHEQRPTAPQLPTIADSNGKRRIGATQSSLFAWCMLSFGLMAFVFGGVLLGWSFATDRAELWRLGMPFAMGGQAALIIGLVFQLDGLAKSNRVASDALNDLDSQLDELRHTTSLLSSSRSTPSQSFYLHMAEGASPKLLLADLKGQLDLLAERISDAR